MTDDKRLDITALMAAQMLVATRGKEDELTPEEAAALADEVFEACELRLEDRKEQEHRQGLRP